MSIDNSHHTFLSVGTSVYRLVCFQLRKSLLQCYVLLGGSFVYDVYSRDISNIFPLPWLYNKTTLTQQILYVSSLSGLQVPSVLTITTFILSRLDIVSSDQDLCTTSIDSDVVPPIVMYTSLMATYLEEGKLAIILYNTLPIICIHIPMTSWIWWVYRYNVKVWWSHRIQGIFV